MSLETNVRNRLWGYQKAWFRADVIAGLAAAAIVIPKAMAYATIAGLPVQVGLYTAFLPMAIYAALGSSRVLSVSTTTTLAILTGVELGQVAPQADLASLTKALATITLLVGGILVVASLLRLGFVASFISEPVLVGFKAGIGLVIVLDQVPKILGIHLPRSSLFRNLLAMAHGLRETSLPTLAVGFVIMAVLVGIERLLPRAPAPLIALAVGIIGTYLFKLHEHGVALVGNVPKGFPAITVPKPSLVGELWPGALGLALMSFTETIAAGRAFARSDEAAPRANRELLATGLANATGALLGSMPVGGGTSQTAVNRRAGAHTQFAELVTVGLVLATMLALAPLVAMVPQATLAAVVIVYSIGLIQPVEFKSILKVRRTEFVWAMTAFAGVVLVGTLKGIIVAIVVSLVALAYQLADPPVYELGRKPGTNVFRPLSNDHPDDHVFPGLLLVRLEGRIFFANAELTGQRITQLIDRAKPRVVALDLSSVPDLEYTALKMLAEAEKKQRSRGVSLWLVGLNPGVLSMAKRSPLGDALESEAFQFNVADAVTRYVAHYATPTAA